ncbi:MAG: hypothetical protein JSV33_11555 [bacterium]|nr:MAG: hypothetical protein JSV33_11555 [bacterium]
MVASLACLCIVVDAHAGELVQDGGFEIGDFHPAWVHGAMNLSGQSQADWADHAVVLDLPFTGNYSALLGFKYTQPQQRRFAFMYHDITIPTNVSAATLYFKFRHQGYDGPNDPFIVEIRDLSDNTLATVVDYAFSERSQQFKDSGWIEDDGAGPAGYDMAAYAGQTVRIYFRQMNLADNFYETWTFVDDVSFVYKKYVDLILDGDGDDRFGDLGSGAGGSSTESAEAGETVTYLLDIENEGLDDDSYRLTVSPPPGWTVVLRYGGTDYSFPWTTPIVGAGASIQAELIVTVPGGEPLGGYTTIVDAVSTAFGDRFDSVRLETNVVPADHLADLVIDGDGLGVIDSLGWGGFSYRETPSDTEVTFDIDLVNGGVLIDSFTIWFRPEAPLTAVIEEGAITHSGAFTTGAIDPGGSASFTLRVTVPLDILGGDYTTLVYAKSVTDTLRKDGVRAVAGVRAPRVDMVINGSGDGIIDPTLSGLGGSSTIMGVRGNTVYFPVTVQNEGNVVDSFTMTWVKPPGGWTAVINDGSVDHVLPWITPAFAPESERDYLLAVTVPASAAFETFQSLLHAVSQLDGDVAESVTASITVVEGNEIDLIIDGVGDNVYGPLGSGIGGSSVQAANPGDTLTFTITVQNESGEDLFDIQWAAPPGWEAVIGDSTSSMRGVPAGDYTMEVRVPAACANGTFEVVVDGVKTNKPFLVDSAKGVVVVTVPPIVDALIDGNGDESFGTPGNGNGGFSEQSTIGGQTVNFTLELQNQGGGNESYVVTWNGFIGWTALLAGSASPFTTAVIGPGASDLYVFEVTIPVTAAEGDYDYILDVVSTVDSTNVESVTARVHINPPPRVDLVIDGNGAFDTAPAGSGEGGRSLVFGEPDTMTTAVLEVVNRGGFPDSFQIDWVEPDGWPAGSVLLSDGTNDYNSPFVTELLDPGASLSLTVKIFIPATATQRSRVIMNAVGLTRDLEDSILLEIGVTCFVVGTVFDDADHDGLYDPGEEYCANVTIGLSDPGGWITQITDAGGTCLFEVASGIVRQIIEVTPTGMVSLSPDTLALPALAAGDTVQVYFADCRGPSLAPECDVSAPSGGFVDIPHTITAGTSGQASLMAVLPAGWVEVFYRDNNGDGRLDGGDSRLTTADLDLDPAVPGRDVVPIIMRVYIPAQVPPGTVESVSLVCEQTLSGTAITVQALVVDRVTVLASSSGMLRLTKEVNLAQARPGDVITYTIHFMNPGVEGVQEIEIIDPIAEQVDFVLDAFGAGNDVAWVNGGATVYLTADPTDPDEALLEMPERRLRIILSRQNPFVLECGAEGSIIYMVRIR